MSFFSLSLMISKDPTLTVKRTFLLEGTQECKVQAITRFFFFSELDLESCTLFSSPTSSKLYLSSWGKACSYHAA